MKRKQSIKIEQKRKLHVTTKSLIQRLPILNQCRLKLTFFLSVPLFHTHHKQAIQMHKNKSNALMLAQIYTNVPKNQNK